MRGYPIVAIRAFIEATRDSGYKSTSSAIAELVDNALEAEATAVDVRIEAGEESGKQITVTDNGCGMSPATMQLALQFGGSTRFNSRRGLGRYGMGLPNGSLSQARRVDVYSWHNPHAIWSSYLDVDEVSSGTLDSVPTPIRFRPTNQAEYPATKSGTMVVLTKCDRLDFKTIRALVRRLHADLGRLFRKQLYDGREIRVNDKQLVPFDPLFVQEGANMVGAQQFGPPLNYEITPPGVKMADASLVTVRFALLPIEQWHSLSNEEKNRHGISKGAGVSVVRAGREIDYGWYFMGTKRKENYDDWWRCEVSFSPDLDELFGVTHTKQKVNPTETLDEILTPDLERIARDLNNQVRKTYNAIRSQQSGQSGAKIAEGRDGFMEPVRLRGKNAGRKALSSLDYRIDTKPLEDVSFYLPTLTRDKLSLVLNQEHNFYRKVYEPLSGAVAVEAEHVLEHFQLLLLAAARAECAMKSSDEKSVVRRLRESWSNALTAFLD